MRRMDTVYPRLFVPTRPICTFGSCRSAAAANSYPVFRDGSVNYVTFRKFFSDTPNSAVGPGNP